MKTIQIKGIKNEKRVEELQKALSLVRESMIIVCENIPSNTQADKGRKEFQDKMYEAESSASRLILEISEAIGALTASDVADTYLDFN